MMQARDASGRKVSLLNDEMGAYKTYEDTRPYSSSYPATSQLYSQAYQAALANSTSSSPNTPELLRSDSYDSQISNDPISPLTPSAVYADYSRGVVYSADGRSVYDDYVMDGQTLQRPGITGESSRSGSYDDDASSPAAGGAPGAERSGKRYPCRYRDSHGCEKTFTTSGHASRHSKIHTAEKAVQCTFPGCSKKFTRADNMKQHLETHFKDKSRYSASRPSVAGRRSSSSVKSSASSASSSNRSSGVPVDSTPLPSPGIATGSAWDMRGLNLPLPSRPGAARTPSSGLDALAMAIACQEAGGA